MNALDEIKRKMAAERQYPPTWQFSETRELYGRITEKKTVPRPDGTENDVIIVEQENGELVTVWKTSTLEDVFKKVAVGKAIGLKYLGEAVSKKGRTYHDIRCEIEG